MTAVTLSSQDASSRGDAGELAACPIQVSLDVLGQKWTMLILRDAFGGDQRFSDLIESLGCPRALLTARLRMLCDLGLMRIRPVAVAGQRSRHVYELTDDGRTIAPALIALYDWGERRLPDDGRVPASEPGSCPCGARVNAVLACTAGHAVEAGDVVIHDHRRADRHP